MDFSEEVEVLFQNKDYDRLLEVIFNPDNQATVQAFGMDLITRICECGIAFCTELDSLRACQDMLMHVVRSVRPKEALISLLEQAELFVNSDSDKFSSLLAPLQHVVMNLPKKREHSFSWVLSILNSHMRSRHEFPAKWKSRFIQGKDATLMEADEEIKGILVSYREYCNFYAPFVQQSLVEKTAALSSKDHATLSIINRQQDILRDHLVQLLGDPLLHFDLHWEEEDQSKENERKFPNHLHSNNNANEDDERPKIKTDARLISERLMEFLHFVDHNPDYYLEWSARKLFLEKTNLKNKPIYCGDDESDDADSDECHVDFSSVVNYYYLIYVEGMNTTNIPLVLSPSHVFTATCPLMLSILQDEKRSGPVSILKCMDLSLSLLDRIDEKVPGIRLESGLLETTDFINFVECVAYQTVYSETLQVRKQGLQVMRNIMWKFEPKGRHDFILFVFNRIPHDGIKGYIITQLKDSIRVALDSKNKEMQEIFTGKILMKLLRLTCRLQNGVTTDLMDNKEQILSALNLILYLTLRDKTSNTTGFLEVLPDIEGKLLVPLVDAIKLTRAHYQLKLKELTDDPKAAAEAQRKKHKELSGLMDLQMGDSPSMMSLEEMKGSIDDQKGALRTFLGALDLMEGNLFRVTELCDAFKKSVNAS